MVFKFGFDHLKAVLEHLKTLTQEERPYNITWGGRTNHSTLFYDSLKEKSAFKGIDGSITICTETTLTERLKTVKQIATSFYVSYENWEIGNPDEEKAATAPTLTLSQLQSLVHKNFATSMSAINPEMLADINALLKDVGAEDNR